MSFAIRLESYCFSINSFSFCLVKHSKNTIGLCQENRCKPPRRVKLNPGWRLLPAPLLTLMNDSFWLLSALDFLVFPQIGQRVNLLIRIAVESAASGDQPED